MYPKTNFISRNKYFIRNLFILTIFVFICLILKIPENAKAQSVIPIEVKFIGSLDVTLQQLSSGTPGNGYLLYFLPENGPTHPSLVVRLEKDFDSNYALAEIFDAPPGLNYVPIELDRNIVIIQESLSPSIIIKSLDGWWVKNGVIEFNLDIQINGPIDAVWGGITYPAYKLNLIKPGDQAAIIKIRDSERRNSYYACYRCKGLGN